MATIKGTFASNNNNLNLYIVWSSKQDTASNKSTVTAKLYLKKVTSYAQTYKSNTPCSITINGDTSNYTKNIDTRGWSVGSAHLIETKTLTVSHDSDGSKSIKIGGKIDFSGLNPGRGTIPSTTVKLPTIPRASTFSVSGTKNVGSTITIDIARASSSFTHKIQVSFNGGSFSTIASGVGTSKSYTLPTSWANSMKSSTAPFQIKVITYNGSTSVGSKTNSYTVSLPSSYAPTINYVTISEGNTAVTTGMYVQNLSKLKILVSATAKSGATISNYTYKINGTTYNSSSSNSVTTSAIKAVGSVTVQVVVKDSRGLSSSYSKSINVVSQGDINIGSLSTKRTNSLGNPYANGEFFTVYCKLSATYSMTVNIQYKMSSSASWNSKSLGDVGTSYTLDWYNPKINIGTLYSYDIRIKVTTAYATKYSQTVTITPTYVIMDFKNNGRGVCFGSTCTKDGVEVKGQHLYVTDSIIRIDRCPLDTGESRIEFLNCGNSNLNMTLFGGSSTSDNQFGLYDRTNNKSVWKYHKNGKLQIDVPLFVSSDSIQFKTIDGGTNSCSCASLSSDRNIMYFGSSNSVSSVPETRVRGTSVRLYAHTGGVYLGTSGSTAVTSDRNLKRDITSLDDRYIKFFNTLKPVTYIYKDGGHRKHVGFIAQEVEKALLECGLTTEDFAGLVKETNVDIDTKDGKTVHYDELYSLRYEEFVALNTRIIQSLLVRIDELERKVL